MPTPLSPPGPRIPVTEVDARATLVGIAPGWYRARDLFPRYEAVVSAAGRPPGTVKNLGEALGRMGLEREWVHGHVYAWHVTEELAGQTA